MDYVTVDTGALFWAIFGFAVGLLILWLIIYSAVRVAINDTIRPGRPHFRAAVTEGSDGLHLVVTNVGAAPAIGAEMLFDLAYGAAPIAQTALVEVGASFEGLMGRQPAGASEQVRMLRVRWRGGPDASWARRSEAIPVLVPAGPAE